MFKRRVAGLLTPLVVVMMLLSACGSENATPTTGAGSQSNPTSAPAATSAAGNAGQATSAPSTGGEGMIDHLDFGSFGGGDNPQLNYNPYSPNVLNKDYMFEPLMI